MARSNQKVKQKRKVSSGRVVIRATFNNTIVTITGPSGEVLASGSGGQTAKGSRKSTPYAGQLAAENAAKKAIELYDLRDVDVVVIGPGAGRDSAVRALDAAGLEVRSIKDATPIPHNGVKIRKKRRV